MLELPLDLGPADCCHSLGGTTEQTARVKHPESQVGGAGGRLTSPVTSPGESVVKLCWFKYTVLLAWGG